ncbi:DUF2796 domain-containing protein [Pontibacterium sp.]|uniref:DUF2796 domain-containing protein n=1 Tax=Pontibacterium sp. TaxID=2036026 RepID=UPI003512995B
MAQIRQKQKAFVSGVMLSLLTATVQAQGLDDHGDDHGGSLGAHVHGIASLNMALDGKFLELEFHTPAANIYGFEHAPRTEEQFTQVREAQRTLQQANKLFVLTHAAGCRLGRVELEQSSEEGEHHEAHAGHEHHEEKHADHDHHAEHAAHDKHEKHDDHHDDHGHHEKHDDHHEEHASHEKHDDHDDHHAHKEHAKHDAHGKDEHDHAHHDKHDDHDDHHKHEEHAHHVGEENGHSDLSVHYYYQCSAPEKLNSLEVGLFKAFPALEKLNLQLITPRVQQGKTLTARSYRVDF